MKTDGGAEPDRAEPDRAEPDRAEPDRAELDPTRVRDQPALTTSTGAIWLIVGGLFAAVSLGVLIPMSALPGGTVAAVAAIVIVLIYVGMIVVQFAISPGRRRLGLHATGMLLIAAVALGTVLFVAAGAWTAAS